jgi:predicted outer membrane repeat protein
LARLLLFVAVSLSAVAVLAPVTIAASTTVNCAGLQAALNASGNGDVITLDGVCTNQSFTLKSDAAITLQGDPSDGADGFDGGASATARILTGQGVTDTTIQRLFFKNGKSNDAGGAISLTGDIAPTIRECSFTDNSATGRGGAVYISQANVGDNGAVTVDLNTFSGNHGGEGGGLWIDSYGQYTISDNTFGTNTVGGNGGGFGVAGHTTGDIFGNTVSTNTATSSGGGAFVRLVGTAPISAFAAFQPTAADVDIAENDFLGNTTMGQGGGLRLELFLEQAPAKVAQGSAKSVNQDGNSFDGNTSSSGGGESIDGIVQQVFKAGTSLAVGSLSVTSTDDRFTNNSANDGGGLVLRPFTLITRKALQGSPVALSFTGRNLVAAGNDKTGQSGSAGGIQVNTGDLTLLDSTIAGNAGPQIQGRGPQGPTEPGSGNLVLTNSIVFGSGADDDGVGTIFTSRTVQYTDACASGVPLPGAGNICIDPLLIDPGAGDVHETATSPTIDLGSNALVPPDLTEDYEGDPRIVDGDNDAIAVVDMGADEARLPTAIQLLSLGAERARKGVIVRWRMASEAGVAGYHLYRQGTTKRVRLDPRTIAARGGVGPRSHSYVDRRAPRSRRPLRYWLQILQANGPSLWRTTQLW